MHEIEKGEASVKAKGGPLQNSERIYEQTIVRADWNFRTSLAGGYPTFDISGEGHNQDRPRDTVYSACSQLWVGIGTHNNLRADHSVRPS